MYNRPPDIVELERMLADGECDADLNAKAIAIFKRLEQETQVMGSIGSIGLLQMMELERRDFMRVIASIQHHRHVHVLDEFEQFLSSQKKGTP